MRVVGAGLLMLGSACDTELETVPEGALAIVGDTVLWPDELERRRGELGAYGQRRFGREGGRMALLEGAITERLLELEAKRVGMGDDPRVEWAVTEELARLQLAADLERRVPERSIAEDQAALRRYYDANPAQFSLPEERSAELIDFEKVEEAEAMLAGLASGELTWEQLSQEKFTTAQPRDDKRFPMYHRHLFDPSLGVGDVVPIPLYAQSKVQVARVREIIPARLKPFDDARVQAELVDAVRGPLLETARTELMAELAQRFPSETP